MPYCQSCGEEVDEAAQFCANCGSQLSGDDEEDVEPLSDESSDSAETADEMSDMRRHEYEKLADKSVLIGVILGGLLGPFGYVYIGNWRWAIINFFTLNYLLMGIFLVPIHVSADILKARKKLGREKLGYEKTVEFIENI